MEFTPLSTLFTLFILPASINFFVKRCDTACRFRKKLSVDISDEFDR